MKQCYRSVLIVRTFWRRGLAFPFMSADANVSPLDMRSKKSFWKSLCNQNVNSSSHTAYDAKVTWYLTVVLSHDLTEVIFFLSPDTFGTRSTCPFISALAKVSVFDMRSKNSFFVGKKVSNYLVCSNNFYAARNLPWSSCHCLTSG